MLSSGSRKAMKTLLILPAAGWITTAANATSAGECASRLAEKRFASYDLYATAGVRSHPQRQKLAYSASS